MKKLSLIALVVVAGVLVWLSKSNPPLPPPEPRQVLLQFVLRSNGLIHADEPPRPFTGQVIERYRSGTLKSQSDIVEGKLHGVSKGWFTNGVLQVEEPFANGRSHGLRTKWFASGEKLSEAEIVDGKLQGTFRKWHENGRLAQELHMRDGEAHGLPRAWHASGYLKARVTLTNGTVLEQEFFEDGQHLEKP